MENQEEIESIIIPACPKNRLERAAGIYSYILHPFFMPVVGTFLILFGNTFISLLPLHLKYYLLATVSLFTIGIPAIGILSLRKLGIISSLSLSSRNDRIVPLIIVAIGYMLCAYILSDYLIIQLIHRILFAALASVAICFIVNFYWKISLHMTAMGGVVGMLLSINLLGYGTMNSMLLLFILLAGLLGSARLYLGRHNIWQILAGFTVGLLTVGVFIYFI